MGLGQKKGAAGPLLATLVRYLGASCCVMAVGQGFEPREPLGSTVFKTAAFDHSASPP